MAYWCGLDIHVFGIYISFVLFKFAEMCYFHHGMLFHLLKRQNTRHSIEITYFEEICVETDSLYKKNKSCITNFRIHFPKMTIFLVRICIHLCEITKCSGKQDMCNGCHELKLATNI